MTTLSRGLASSPLGGSLNAEIPKVRVHDDTLDGATKLAREAGMSLSEWVRTLIEIRVHGVDTVSALHTSRLKNVAGMGTN